MIRPVIPHRINTGRLRFTRWLALVLSASLAVPVSAAQSVEMAIVLSSDLEPYQQAIAGFDKERGSVTKPYRLEQAPAVIRAEPRVVIAVGGKAAVARYADSSALVYCMAPGTVVGPAQRKGLTVQISVAPSAKVALAAMRRLQPSLRRLTGLWVSPSSESYLADCKRAARDAGVDFTAIRLEQPDKLPDLLRKLQGQTDALWLPPDPLLINPQALVLLGQFSASAHVPFYSAVAGMADRGATATIAVSYDEVGRAAARAVEQILRGGSPPFEVYPERIQIVVNAGAAQRAGLMLSEEQTRGAEKVIP